MSDQSLINEDLAPIAQDKRKWGTWNYAALWISMSLCIPTYMLASSLIEGGMNWWQSILTIFIGNSIVLIPMILNAKSISKDGFNIIASPWTCPPWMKDNKNYVGGKLLPEYFPNIFGEDENLPLDYDAALNAFNNITNEINQ